MPNADTAYCQHPSLNPGLVDLARKIEAATGVDPQIAGTAAGAFLSMPNAPGYGLWDPPIGWGRIHGQAYDALQDYLAAVEVSAEPKAA